MRPFPGLVNFVPALAYLFCLNLPAAFSQPGNGLLRFPVLHQSFIHFQLHPAGIESRIISKFDLNLVWRPLRIAFQAPSSSSSFPGLVIPGAVCFPVPSFPSSLPFPPSPIDSVGRSVAVVRPHQNRHYLLFLGSLGSPLSSDLEGSRGFNSDIRGSY